MNFSFNKTVCLKIALNKANKPNGSCENFKEYLTVIDGEIETVIFRYSECTKNFMTGEQEETLFFLRESGEQIEYELIGQLYELVDVK